jgi:hypothetical protein
MYKCLAIEQKLCEIVKATLEQNGLTYCHMYTNRQRRNNAFTGKRSHKFYNIVAASGRSKFNKLSIFAKIRKVEGLIDACNENSDKIYTIYVVINRENKISVRISP